MIPGFSACRETPEFSTFIYQRNIVAKVATKLEFLVAKLKVVLALATVSVAISSPALLLFDSHEVWLAQLEHMHGFHQN